MFHKSFWERTERKPWWEFCMSAECKLVPSLPPEPQSQYSKHVSSTDYQVVLPSLWTTTTRQGFWLDERWRHKHTTATASAWLLLNQQIPESGSKVITDLQKYRIIYMNKPPSECWTRSHQTTLSFVLLSLQSCGCWTCGLLLFLPLFCNFFSFLSVFFIIIFVVSQSQESHNQGGRG